MKDMLLRLLTHEVQIAISSKRVSNEANHFMKLDSAINNWSKRCEHTHVCVHLCIHQSKCQCLITNKCLLKKNNIKKIGVLEEFLILFFCFLGFSFFFKHVFYFIRGELEKSVRSKEHGLVNMT